MATHSFAELEIRLTPKIDDRKVRSALERISKEPVKFRYEPQVPRGAEFAKTLPHLSALYPAKFAAQYNELLQRAMSSGEMLRRLGVQAPSIPTPTAREFERIYNVMGRQAAEMALQGQRLAIERVASTTEGIVSAVNALMQGQVAQLEKAKPRPTAPSEPQRQEPVSPETAPWLPARKQTNWLAEAANRAASALGGVGNTLSGLSTRVSGFGQVGNVLASGLSALSNAANSASAKLKSVSSALSSVGKAKVPQIPAEVSAAERLANVTRMPLAEIYRQISLALQNVGVRVSHSLIRAAAVGVKSGAMTISQAIQGLVVGATQYRRVLAETGLQADMTTRSFKQLSQSLQLSRAITAKQGPTFLPSAAGQLPSPAQALAVSTAMDTATRKTQGFMKSLLTLRWEIFTIMFFFYSFIQSIEALFRAVEEGARVIAAVTSATRALSIASVENVDELVIALQEASGGFYTLEESASRLGALFAAGLPPEMIRFAPQLMEIARAIGALRAANVDEVYRGITEAIIRAEFRTARTVGALTGNLEDLLQAYKSHIAEMRKTGQPLTDVERNLEELGVSVANSTAALSAYEKQWLILWGVMTRGEKITAILGDEYDDVRENVQSAKTAVQDLANAIDAALAEKLAPAMGQFAKTLYAVVGATREQQRLMDGSRPRYHLLQQRVEALAASYREQGLSAREAYRRAREEIYDEMAKLGKAHLLAMAGAERARKSMKDIGDAKQAAEDLIELAKATGEAAEAFESLAKVNLDAYFDSLRQALQMTLQWRRSEEERQIRWRREEEDFQRDYARRLADIEADARKSRDKVARQYHDREAEARADLARRLAQIERDLAMELTRIWRDYHDEMWQAEADRDAMAALMAARRRERRTLEARESAEEQRRRAYEQFQDAVENARKQMQQELDTIRQQYEERIAELKAWQEQELENRRIARQRELEDEQRSRQREVEDLQRALAFRLAEIAISNNKRLTEEERYRMLSYAAMVAYSNRSMDEINRMLFGPNGLVTRTRVGYIEMTAETNRAFGQILALRNMYAQFLQVPIIIPIQFQVTPPSGWLPTGMPSPTMPIPVRARATGGMDIVQGPSLFLFGEKGPELVISKPLPGGPVGGLSGSFHHEIRAIVQAEVEDLGARVTYAVQRALERVF